MGNICPLTCLRKHDGSSDTSHKLKEGQTVADKIRWAHKSALRDKRRAAKKHVKFATDLETAPSRGSARISESDLRSTVRFGSIDEHAKQATLQDAESFEGLIAYLLQWVPPEGGVSVSTRTPTPIHTLYDIPLPEDEEAEDILPTEQLQKHVQEQEEFRPSGSREDEEVRDGRSTKSSVRTGEGSHEDDAEERLQQKEEVEFQAMEGQAHQGDVLMTADFSPSEQKYKMDEDEASVRSGKNTPGSRDSLGHSQQEKKESSSLTSVAISLDSVGSLGTVKGKQLEDVIKSNSNAGKRTSTPIQGDNASSGRASGNRASTENSNHPSTIKSASASINSKGRAIDLPAVEDAEPPAAGNVSLVAKTTGKEETASGSRPGAESPEEAGKKSAGSQAVRARSVTPSSEASSCLTERDRNSLVLLRGLLAWMSWHQFGDLEPQRDDLQDEEKEATEGEEKKGEGGGEEDKTKEDGEEDEDGKEEKEAEDLFENLNPIALLKLLKRRELTHAEVLATLCIQADIFCEVITGRIKGDSYQPGNTVLPYGQWNAVFLAGGWRLIHPEWFARPVEYYKKRKTRPKRKVSEAETINTDAIFPDPRSISELRSAGVVVNVSEEKSNVTGSSKQSVTSKGSKKASKSETNASVNDADDSKDNSVRTGSPVALSHGTGSQKVNFKDGAAPGTNADIGLNGLPPNQTSAKATEENKKGPHLTDSEVKGATVNQGGDAKQSAVEKSYIMDGDAEDDEASVEDDKLPSEVQPEPPDPRDTVGKEVSVKTEISRLGMNTPGRHATANSFTDFWFMTQPEHFVHRCYPDERKWQVLLPRHQVKTYNDFAQLPLIYPASYELGLALTRENSCVIGSWHGISTIEFDMIGFRHRQLHLQHEISIIQLDHLMEVKRDRDLKKYVFYSRKRDSFSYEIRFPVAGFYRFAVIGYYHGSKRKQKCCEFKLNCSKRQKNCRKLPIDAGPLGWGYGPCMEDVGLVNPSHWDPKVRVRPFSHANDARYDVKTKTKVVLTFTVQPDKLKMTSYRALLLIDTWTAPELSKLQEYVTSEVDEQRHLLRIELSVPVSGEYALAIQAARTPSNPSIPPSFFSVCNYLVTTLEDSVQELTDKQEKARRIVFELISQSERMVSRLSNFQFDEDWEKRQEVETKLNDFLRFLEHHYMKIEMRELLVKLQRSVEFM